MPPSTSLGVVHRFLSPTVAGILSAMVGYGGTFIVIIQAAYQADLDDINLL